MFFDFFFKKWASCKGGYPTDSFARRPWRCRKVKTVNGFKARGRRATAVVFCTTPHPVWHLPLTVAAGLSIHGGDMPPNRPKLRIILINRVDTL